MRLIALFNLKPGISTETYEDWARSVDLPTVRGLKSIDGFQVDRTLAVMGSDAPPPYKYIEIIDIKIFQGNLIIEVRVAIDQTHLVHVHHPQCPTVIVIIVQGTIG